MNKILTIREYRQQLHECNSRCIVEEDINRFEKDIKQLKTLIKIAKEEMQSK